MCPCAHVLSVNTISRPQHRRAAECGALEQATGNKHRTGPLCEPVVTWQIIFNSTSYTAQCFHNNPSLGVIHPETAGGGGCWCNDSRQRSDWRQEQNIWRECGDLDTEYSDSRHRTSTKCWPDIKMPRFAQSAHSAALLHLPHSGAAAVPRYRCDAGTRHE